MLNRDITEAAALIARMKKGEVPENVDLGRLNGHGTAIATLVEARQSGEARFNRQLELILDADPELRSALNTTRGAEAQRKRWYTAKEMVARPIPASLLVRNGVVIPDKAITALAGQSGKGKSFVALDWAMALAQDYAVVYIAAEKAVLFGERMAAWSKHHKRPIDVLPYFYEGSVFMNDRDEVTQFIDGAKAWEQPIRAVFVDTVARCMTGDENSSEDMGNFIAGCSRIQRELDCAVILVHHLGKDLSRGMRGSNRLECDIDAVILLKVKDGKIILENTKQSSMEEFKEVAFSLELVEFVDDATKRKIRSRVVVPTTMPAKKEEGKRHAHSLEAILGILAREPNGLTQRMIHSKTTNSKSTVNRAKDRLVELKLIRLDESTLRYHILESGLDYLRQHGLLTEGVRSSDSSESPETEPN